MQKSRRGSLRDGFPFPEGSSENKTAAIAGGRLFFMQSKRLRKSDHRDEDFVVLGRPGSDLLFQVLRLSTIGAGEFYGRVRDGIGYRPPAKTTRPAKDECEARRLSNSALTPLPSRRRRMGISNESNQDNRAISTGKLNALPHLHTRPINVVVYHGS